MNLFKVLARCSFVMAALFLSGCEETFINKVQILVSPGGKEARIKLVFDSAIETGLSGTLKYRDLASFFVNPPEMKDEIVGMLVSESILSDPDLRPLVPVNTLANGIPLAVGVPLTEIKSDKPVSPKFGLYGYADIKNQVWVGSGIVLTYHDPKLFPVGFSSRQGFMPDSKRNPAIIAQLNGPILNEDGTVGRFATFSLFVNLKRVLSEINPGKEVSFSPLRKKKSTNN